MSHLRDIYCLGLWVNSLTATIEIQTIQQYIPVMFIILFKLVLNFQSLDKVWSFNWIVSSSTFQCYCLLIAVQDASNINFLGQILKWDYAADSH